MVDEVYPCKMIATLRYNQESDQTIVDFSQYDKKGVIGVTVDYKKAPSSAKEEALDGESLFYSPAVVYKLGGHWFWKIL